MVKLSGRGHLGFCWDFTLGFWGGSGAGGGQGCGGVAGDEGFKRRFAAGDVAAAAGHDEGDVGEA